MSWRTREKYECAEGLANNARLAQRLHDEGLLYALNFMVLHDLGLAIGVVGHLIPTTERVEGVTALILMDSDDPPVYYEDAAHERNIAKLRLAGHDELADRIEKMRNPDQGD
jgi:hypothetical protein